jgi:hypothetical protein
VVKPPKKTADRPRRPLLLAISPRRNADEHECRERQRNDINRTEHDDSPVSLVKFVLFTSLYAGCDSDRSYRRSVKRAAWPSAAST